MATIKKTLFLLSFVTALTIETGMLYADNGVNVYLDGTYLSRFVWRGEMWTDDPVLWQTTTVTWKGFRSYNFFNVDLTDINDDKFQCNEYDFILDYTFSFNRFSIAPGVLHFSSPTDFFEPTTKITLQVKTDFFLNPGLRIRVDPEKSRGSYYILDVSQRYMLPSSTIPIDFYGSLGASQPRYYRRYLDSTTVLTDLLLGISIPLPVGYDFILSPLVEFTSLLDSSVRDAQDEHGYDKDAFTYGIRLGRSITF